MTMRRKEFELHDKWGNVADLVKDLQMKRCGEARLKAYIDLWFAECKEINEMALGQED